MKIPLALLGLTLCTLPLLAQSATRRVVAPCELLTSSLTPAGGENPNKDREFIILVQNNSTRPVAIPHSPQFGWRVDVAKKNGWKLKAEGGPVRRASATDAHIIVTGVSGAAPMVEIPPTHAQSFSADLPEAAQAFHPSHRGHSTLRLTLYWAASPELARLYPAVPVCGLAPELVTNALLP
jgi:hypothetical protein